MSEQVEAELVAEQLRRAIDLLRAELLHQQQELKHLHELADHRLSALENLANDHEARLRSATEGVTQFKVWAGVATGGSWVVSLAALLRAWFGS